MQITIVYMNTCPSTALLAGARHSAQGELEKINEQRPTTNEDVDGGTEAGDPSVHVTTPRDDGRARGLAVGGGDVDEKGRQAERRGKNRADTERGGRMGDQSRAEANPNL